MTENDPLKEEIDRMKESDPAPQFSGGGKAAVLGMMDEMVVDEPSAWQGVLEEVRAFLRPAFVGGLGAVGAVGLFVGSLAAPTSLATVETQEILPEEELAQYYEFAFAFEVEEEQVLEEGLN